MHHIIVESKAKSKCEITSSIDGHILQIKKMYVTAYFGLGLQEHQSIMDSQQTHKSDLYIIDLLGFVQCKTPYKQKDKMLFCIP